MIISFKHKFIFIKTRKTGGTSIQVELSKHSGPDDIITGELVDDNGKVWESYGPGKNINKFFTDNPHPNVVDIKYWIETNGYVWDDFFKFVIIRNPQDLVISRYHWNIVGKSKVEASVNGFRNWFLNLYSHGEYMNDIQWQYIFDYEGENIIDYIGTYHNIEDSYKRICECIGIEYSPLLNLKGKYREKKFHYSNYYDKDCIELLSTLFEKDFKFMNLFGYTITTHERFKPIGCRYNLIPNHPSIGNENINGPCVIKDDVSGKYFMYYAHHQGKDIKFAYSNHPLGQWIYELEGKYISCLTLKESKADNHIASPDVVKNEDGNYIMYFHGDYNDKQHTRYAISKDGRDYDYLDSPGPYPHFYFRTFIWNDKKLGIAKKNNLSGVLYQANPVTGIYEEQFDLIDKMRHCSVYIKGNILYIFYSKIGDYIEHIRVCHVLLDDDINKWEIIDDYDLLYPVEEFEGNKIKSMSSTPVSVYGLINQLRDPYLFVDGDKFYLYYAAAGEHSIGCTELELYHEHK